ncbi:hypothetical protein Pfo_004271 [Paulownia fortunei]|nr:hypothetical protein Pfo_004271 [Paulownia fortunei]
MSVISEQEISPVASVITVSQDETSSQESDREKENTTHEERPTRLNLVSSKTRSHSSSPILAQKQSRNLGYAGYSARRLQKTMSCKSLGELELEEVKGFMDLGFIFKKEKLNKRMMSLIPGLQRIHACKTKEQDSRDSFEFTNNTDNVEDEEEEEEEEDDERKRG